MIHVMSLLSRPAFPVQISVIDSFRDMVCFNISGVVQSAIIRETCRYTLSIACGGIFNTLHNSPAYFKVGSERPEM